MRDIHGALRQALKAELAERVRPYGATKRNPVAKEREVMREDGGRAAEREPEIGGKVLPIQFKGFGKSVKHKVEIQLTDNTEIEVWTSIHALSRK